MKDVLSQWDRAVKAFRRAYLDGGPRESSGAHDAAERRSGGRLSLAVEGCTHRRGACSRHLPLPVNRWN